MKERGKEVKAELLGGQKAAEMSSLDGSSRSNSRLVTPNLKNFAASGVPLLNPSVDGRSIPEGYS
jgi:hypothetical protein